MVWHRTSLSQHAGYLRAWRWGGELEPIVLLGMLNDVAHTAAWGSLEVRGRNHSLDLQQILCGNSPCASRTLCWPSTRTPSVTTGAPTVTTTLRAHDSSRLRIQSLHIGRQGCWQRDYFRMTVFFPASFVTLLTVIWLDGEHYFSAGMYTPNNIKL